MGGAISGTACSGSKHCIHCLGLAWIDETLPVESSVQQINKNKLQYLFFFIFIKEPDIQACVHKTSGGEVNYDFQSAFWNETSKL